MARKKAPSPDTRIAELKAKLKAQDVEYKRSLKVQKALYKIADAASAARDMGAFYKKVHQIVGGLMYAKSFYVILYDAERDIVGEGGYFVDAFGDTLPEPGPMAKYEKTPSMVVLKNGKTMHLPRKEMGELTERGVINPIGSNSVDWIGVPLKDKKDAFGVVVIQSYEENVLYSDENVKVLEFVAQHIATALTRFRALEAERQRTNELAILNSVGEAMAKTLDVKTVTKIVGDKVRDIFDADVSIKLLDLQTQLIHTAYEYDRGEGGYVDWFEPFPLGKGLTSKIIQKRQPLLLGTLKEQIENGGYIPPAMETNLSGVLAPSWMGAPIIAGDEVLGSVNLSVYREHAFGENDIRLLETLASNMGVAIQNARLFEAEQERVAELAAINSLQTALASQLDFQGVVDTVGNKLTEIFSGENVMIGLLDKASGMMKLPYLVENGERKKNTEFPFNANDKGLGAYVARTLKPLLINSNFDERAKEYGTVSVSDVPAPKCWLGVPIIINGEYIGGFALQNWDYENAYTDSDVRLLQTLAGSLGVALENARLFKAEQERVAELQIINSIQQGLAAELDFQSIVDLVGDKLSEIFNSGDLGIFWHDEKTNLMHYLYTYEHGKRLQIPSAPPSAGGQIETMRKTRQPFVLNNAAEFEKANVPLVPRTDQCKSLASVPIISSDRVLGSISIENYERENAYGDSELRLLTTIAASLGTALENARLFDETQQRNAELAVINAVQGALAAELDIQAINEVVGEKIRDIFDANTILLISFDHENGTMHRHYAYEKGKRLHVDPTPIAPAWANFIEQNKPMLVNDGREYLNQVDPDFVPPAGEMPQSFIVVPLTTKGKLTGAVSIQNVDRKNAFTDSDVRLLETLANATSIALENARLFDEVQKKNAEISESLERETAINDILRVIAESPTDIAPVLDVIARSAAQLSGSEDAKIGLAQDDNLIVAAHYGNIPTFPVGEGIRLNRDSVAGRTIIDGIPHQAIHNQRGVKSEFPEGDKVAKKYGYRITSAVPLMREGKALGAISIRRTRPELLTEKQIALIQSFANQAAIAVANVRLFEAEQQRVAELKIINSVQEGLAKKLDFQSMVDLIGDKVREIFKADTTGVFMYDAERDWTSNAYYVDRGERIPFPDQPVIRPSLGAIVVDNRKHLLLGTTEEAEILGSVRMPSPGEEEDLNESYLGVPILSDQKVIGVINVQSYKQNAYKQDDLRLLTTLANSMSVALESARLFDETQRLLKETEERNTELAVINAIQRGVGAELNFQTIIDMVGDQLREVLQNGDIGIRWYDYENELVHYLYEYEHGERLTIPPAPSRLGWEVITSRREPVVRNTADEVAAAGILPGTDTAKSNAYISIIGSNRVIGSIVVENFEREYAFSDSDVRMLTTVASSMGVALENARLFDETQHLLKETEQRNAELAIVNSVQLGLASKLDMQAIFELVGEKIRSIFDAQVTIIATYEHEIEQVNYRYVAEMGDRFDSTVIPFNDFHRKMIDERKTILFNENLVEQVKALGFKESLTKYDLPKSALNVPLLAGDQVLGHVALENLDREHAFSESDVRLLETLANSMSVALESARLFDETQRLLKITEDRAAELAIINSVQAALASKLDFQGIVDVLGDKFREIFPGQSVGINLVDHAQKLIRVLYMFENGKRYPNVEFPLGQGITTFVINSG